MSEEQGEYKFEKPVEKPLSEVEKAQADVDRYEAKLAEQERELEKTKFYLTICKRSLKAHLKAEEKFKKCKTMTEQEKRTLDALLTLKDKAGKMLVIRLNDKYSACSRDEKQLTMARKNDDIVELFLSEPQNNKDLDQWADAIVHAEELLQVVEDIRNHNKKHPDFFRAVQANLEY